MLYGFLALLTADNLGVVLNPLSKVWLRALKVTNFCGVLTHLLLVSTFDRDGVLNNSYGDALRDLHDNLVLEAERETGLSGRTCIDSNQAMLFVFDAKDSANHCFWMKNMKFPIDILWLDSRKTNVYRVIDARPETYPSQFCPDMETQYVLEIQSGRASELKLEPGVRLNFTP